MARIDLTAGATRSIIAGLILLALALRLGWEFSRPASDAALLELPDQVEYLTLARNVLAGHGLSFIDPRFNARVFAFRMPGYPLFVAACGANVRTVRAAQAGLDAGTVLAVFLLACRTLGERNRRAAVLAAAFIAFNPMLIYVSGLILSETLFVAMLAWGMALLLLGFDTGRVYLWLGGGLLLALAVLVRPSAAVLPPLLGIAAVSLNYRKGGAYQPTPGLGRFGHWPIQIGATMLLLVVLVLAPWAMRNERVLHSWIWTDTNSGITLYDGYNPDATGASDQRFVKSMPQLQNMDEQRRSQYLTSQAMEFIKNYPARVAELALMKTLRTWSPMPLSDQFGRPLYRVIGLLYALPLDVLVLLGLWRAGLRRSAKLFLLLPAIYLTAVHALTIGSMRYRLPAEPALAVLAASGIFHKAQYGETDE